MSDDDLHDLGLAFDLATLQSRALLPARLERRGALKLLAGAGAGLVLVACGSDSKTGSTTTSTIGGATSTTAAGTPAAGTSVDAIPEETGGPYPGDGTNGPNVLVESGIVRQDIRSSFGGYSGTAEGVPLTVDLTIVAASTGAPMAGAAVYLWHCDREGRYSLYSSGATDQNYLRGVQAAGDDGHLSFTSIFPGAYSGRWPHMHFEVYRDLATATSCGQQAGHVAAGPPRGRVRRRLRHRGLRAEHHQPVPDVAPKRHGLQRRVREPARHGHRHRRGRDDRHPHRRHLTSNPGEAIGPVVRLSRSWVPDVGPMTSKVSERDSLPRLGHMPPCPCASNARYRAGRLTKGDAR